MLKKSYLPLIGIAMIVQASCSKNKSEQAALTKVDDPQLEISSSSTAYRVAPTRKALVYTVIDMGTGESTTWYDCTSTGNNCDVGDTTSPTTRMASVAGVRQNYLSNVYATGKKIEDVYTVNDKTLKAYFPQLFDPKLQDGLLSGNYSFDYNGSHLAVLDNRTKAPVYAYQLSQTARYADTTKPEPKTKKAKLDTETGVLDCKEEGSNCTVATRIGEISKNKTVSYLQEFENSFRKADLFRKIIAGKYKVYSYARYVEARPVLGGQSYYIQK